jgi:hypothetical protein
MGPPHTPTCHGVTLVSADFGCSLHSHLDMLRLGPHTVASLSPVVPDLRLPAARALRYQVCSAVDSCDIKGLRRGQLRHQGTPQGGAAKSRYSSEVQAPLRGARDQYSILALQLKKPRPAHILIDRLCMSGPKARRLIAGL